MFPRMMRVSLIACVFVSLAACGAKVPTGNGYSTRTPWKKAKSIELTDNAGKVKGHLSYADAKRARWYILDLPEDGDVNLNMSFAPTDDAGDSSVALEVLNANYKVISEDPDFPLQAAKHDPGEGDDDSAEEGDDDGGGGDSESTQKTRALDELNKGRYYVHVFVNKRLDQADFELQVAYTPMPKTPVTNFPKNVAWAPTLAQVPVIDDAPPPPPPPPPPCKKHDRHCKTGGGGGHTTHTGTGNPPPPPPPPPPPGGTVNGDVVAASASSGGGTDITINRGTNDQLGPGRRGAIDGLKNGTFSISSCNERTCKATVKASVTDVKSSSMSVTIK
jgi:hypothetical protein